MWVKLILFCGSIFFYTTKKMFINGSTYALSIPVNIATVSRVGAFSLNFCFHIFSSENVLYIKIFYRLKVSML